MRKSKPLTEQHKQAISQTMKKVSSGKKPTREWIDKGLAALKIPENLEKRSRRQSELTRGKPKPLDGPFGKHEDNIHAKIWCIISPDHKVYWFKNLNQFLRDNPHLFDPKDLNWVGHGCNAGRGLRALFHLKKDGSLKNHFWKGWQIGDKQDATSNV